MDAKKAPNAPTWDLEPIFPGGSSSGEFTAFRQQLNNDLAAAKIELDELPQVLENSSLAAWTAFILRLQTLAEHLHRAYSFAHCLVSQDVSDTEAHRIEADVHVAYAVFGNLKTALEALAAKQPDREWEKLISSPELN